MKINHVTEIKVMLRFYEYRKGMIIWGQDTDNLEIPTVCYRLTINNNFSNDFVIVYRWENSVIPPMNSRDVMPKNVPGTWGGVGPRIHIMVGWGGWVMKSTSCFGGVWSVMKSTSWYGGVGWGRVSTNNSKFFRAPIVTHFQ